MRKLCLLALVLAAALPARADITIRVSYKVVLNPADGTRPAAITDDQINAAVTAMNALLATYWRGYKIQRVDAISNVGGLNDTTGPSKYYNTNLQSDTTSLHQMESDAQASPGTYQWNAGALNIYVVAGFGGGICSRPGYQIIAMGGASAATGSTTLHEIGHYFDLAHTQGANCSCCDNTLPGACTTPGDDGIADTLPDLACWSQDQIAQNAFKLNYNQLTAAQKAQVDDVFNNLMSYHGTVCAVGGSQARLTEDQLDHWTDTASFTRQFAVTGVTRFVDANGDPGNQTGSSTQPYVTFMNGYNNATPGTDIVLVRPGVYNERGLVLNKAATLRAPRTGKAVIGSAIYRADLGAPQPIYNQEKALANVPSLFPKEPVRLGFTAGDMTFAPGAIKPGTIKPGTTSK